MSLRVERQPIPIDRLPDQLHKHLKSDSPKPLKMMAAQGMLPVGPDHQLAALYNLHNDTDEEVRSAAGKAVGDMPANIVIGTIPRMAHPGVLDWLAQSRGRDQDIIEAIITNRATHDLTIARLAGRVSSRLVEIIATNQVRLLQAPVIIEQIYQNPEARMSTVDRLIELAVREKIELKGIPGLRDALKSGSDSLFSGKESELDEDELARILSQEAKKAEAEAKDEKAFNEMSRREQEEFLREQEQNPRDSTPVFALIDKMSISEKIRFATMCSREGLNILVRDPNKLVHNAAVKSPKVQFPSVAKWSKDKGLPDGVISYIANKRDWVEKYEIKYNLVANPKTALPDAIKFLTHIRTADLKKLQSNRNIPGQLRRQAKQLYRKRTGA